MKKAKYSSGEVKRSRPALPTVKEVGTSQDGSSRLRSNNISSAHIVLSNRSNYNTLVISKLFVETADGKKIVNGISLIIKKGETHAIMGPNGSGKSTLAQAIMGHPGYVITSGSIVVKGINVTKLSPDLRAKHGLFLGFQYPVEVAGVGLSNFLRLAINENRKDGEKKISPIAFRKDLEEQAHVLAFQTDVAGRTLNEGFSGGEKKKAEILQLALLKPDFAILDEPDSGLDVDALKYIAKVIKNLDYNPGLLLITHYQRILKYIKPDFVHILVKGKLVESGKANVAKKVELEGYEQYGI